jgi:hypothetical protein
MLMDQAVEEEAFLSAVRDRNVRRRVAVREVPGLLCQDLSGELVVQYAGVANQSFVPAVPAAGEW